MPTAYAYGRASTDKQSLTEDHQRTACEDYVQRTLVPQGYVYGGWLYDAATTGTSQMFEREQGRRLWALVQPGDTIVWTKLDRAFRSVLDSAQTMNLLDAKGVSFVSLDLGLDTSSPIGRCVFTILTAFAELEVQFIRQRTRDAMAVKRRNKEPYTRYAPYGWRKLGKGKKAVYVPCEEEREQIRHMIGMRDQGVSLERILWAMRPTLRPNGRRWNRNTVTAAINAGRNRFAKEFQASSRRQPESAGSSGHPGR